MSERKFTDEEVFKALECCTIGTFACGKECPYYSIKINLKVTSCRFELMCELFDLINRKNAEIDILIRKHDTLLDEIAEKDAEIERLNAVSEICGDCHKQYAEKIEKAKSEAIKEFAERFKDKYKKPFFYLGSYEQFMREVDDLVKEMTEDKK